MIAVFTATQDEYCNFRFSPKSLFVRIKSPNDVRGRKFTGVIECYGYWRSKYADLAMEELKKRQPELFIN